MMATYEHSSDLVEWGLGFFECNPVPRSEYYTGFTYYAGYEQHISIPYVSESNNVENDEIIAQTLQAELSRVGNSEASENSHSLYHFLGPSYVQDWHYSPPSYSGYESDKEKTTEGVGSSPYSSPWEHANEEDGYSSSPDLRGESTLDDEVSGRLNQMNPISSHVPKTNGEIPTMEEATSDYERLCNRLEYCRLTELKVLGDGNCQFRALSDQLYRTPEHYHLVRQQVVHQLKSHPEIYKEHVSMDYTDYLDKTRESGEWGDHVTLQAAADSYGVKIVVVTSFKDTFYIEILPKIQKSKRVLYLSYWAEVHYNSVYPQGGDLDAIALPRSKSSKKRRWWSFAN